ncbi:hypothetical protein F5Y08DRAFT_297700 [Xylaria arbuscula]|nr:hypothetical protein F5Y08DRAFT_297700 [Xylaria arbuscula]
MSNLYVVRGALRRQLLPRPSHIFLFSRTNFSGRPAREPLTRLPSTPARTRFAPSPTGYLHLGSLRTALFNYLLARATGGQFLIRVEDTDQKRLVPDAEEKLYEDLKWAGLDWDEGPDVDGPYGPYKQSKRLQTYHDHANKLLEDGRAYRCFCTPEELDSMKRLALEESRDPVYNKACSHISAEESAHRAADGEEHCIRFKSDSKAPPVQDLVYGTYRSPVAPDDFIIMKRDGFPTYHFANVVDDHLMKITHVIRGAEWLISTPRHVALYNAFGWEAPQFAHVGLLVDKKRQKLSKRDGTFDLSSWKSQGTLPVALLNYVCLLGWSPSRGGGDTSEVMDMKDMIQKFHLRFTKGDVVVNNKHEFLQKAHVRKNMDKDVILPQIDIALDEVMDTWDHEDHSRPHKDLGVRIGEKLDNVTGDYFWQILELSAQSFTNPVSFLKSNVYLIWEVPKEEHEESLRKESQLLGKLVRRESSEGGEEQLRPRQVSELAEALLASLSELPKEAWTEKGLEQRVKPFVKSIGYVLDEKEGFKPWGWKFLRWVMSASASGLALIPSMVLIGREATLERATDAMKVAQSMNA